MITVMSIGMVKLDEFVETTFRVGCGGGNAEDLIGRRVASRWMGWIGPDKGWLKYIISDISVASSVESQWIDVAQLRSMGASSRCEL